MMWMFFLSTTSTLLHSCVPEIFHLLYIDSGGVRTSGSHLDHSMATAGLLWGGGMGVTIPKNFLARAPG